MKFVTYVFFVLISVVSVAQQPVCKIENQAFEPGEQISYVISYNWGLINAEVAEVLFKVSPETIGDKNVYHLDAIGRTWGSWDWFFKVRDRYQSWVDPVTIKPVKFDRHVDEGGWRLDRKYIFNWNNHTAYTVSKQNDNPISYDTIVFPDCTYDLLSVVYVARCIDYNSYKSEEIIPMTLLLDNKIENLYIRYKGKEILHAGKMGNISTIKFTVMVLEGSVFKEEGENLTVWVTDDANKVPVLIETPIVVGKVRARIRSFSGLKEDFVPQQ